MARLILTTGLLHRKSDTADLPDLFLPFGHYFVHLQRLVYGHPLNTSELEDQFALRSEQQHETRGSHWLDFIPRKRLNRFELHGIGLAQLCACFESVELWIAPTTNDQLELIWLLDYLQRNGAITPRLFLRPAGRRFGAEEELAVMDAPKIAITSAHAEIASKAWHAYCAPTPRAWADLLREDLSGLPHLRNAVLRLLAELPAPGSGLGSTEMALLEFINSSGQARLSMIINTLVYFDDFNRLTIFDEWEVSRLLEPLTFGPAPAVAEVNPELHTLAPGNFRRRDEIHKESRPVLTGFGQAILTGRADFSRHNPIHRWWGGTELTNENLWRWDPQRERLSEP